MLVCIYLLKCKIFLMFVCNPYFAVFFIQFIFKYDLLCIVKYLNK